MKLNVDATTSRGPAVGDGVLAFDAEGGAVLAFVDVSNNTPKEVTPPQGMTHDREAFAFGGTKLVVRDRFSGGLYVFDTQTEQATAISDDSINMGGSGGPNLWEVDGDLIATVNSTVTTADGPGKRIKLVDISDLSSVAITPFEVNPTGTPDGIDLDATSGRVVVRSGDSLFIYTISDPNAAPAEHPRGALQGGLGHGDVGIDGTTVAFFDDDENVTVLDLGSGAFTQATRNPGRQNRGCALCGGRLCYFAMQTADDGGTVSQINRALLAATTSINSPVDPAGDFINGVDENDGRVGFGATTAISPDGQYAFVAGEVAVGVDEMERLSMSTAGGDFQPVADSDDALNVLRAAGVACSDNLVAFLIPESLSGTTSDVSIGYATLPPP